MTTIKLQYNKVLLQLCFSKVMIVSFWTEQYILTMTLYSREFISKLPAIYNYSEQ